MSVSMYKANDAHLITIMHRHMHTYICLYNVTFTRGQPNL